MSRQAGVGWWVLRLLVSPFICDKLAVDMLVASRLSDSTVVSERKAQEVIVIK